MAVVRVWHPIEDLPEGLGTYRPRELDVLVPVWEESRQDLAQSEALAEFHQRLARQWAMETGILERLYTVDPGTTQLLVEQGFDASLVAHGSTDLPPERLVEFLQAHRDALEGLFEFVKSDVPLTTSYIRELHVALTRAQEEAEAVDALGRIVRVPILKGEYRRLPNNPVRGDGTVYLYCPPEQVAEEMERLVRMHREHVRDGVEAAVRAAWLHHR
ncbi:MAG: Fic family protein, partial [Firmicutes bacterium]|nr:Fic family protein [Bacillota bacterium]